MSSFKKIVIKSYKQVFAEVAGNNTSIFKGEGYDFESIKEYEVGDDVRKINWNTSAKMDSLYVNEYRSQRELNIVIASMMGGSVYFGTKKFKSELIAEVASIIAFSAIKNGDKISSYLFSNRLESFVKPSKKIGAVHRLTKEIVEFDPLKKSADYALMAKELYQQVKKKSIIFILADFVDDIDFKILSSKHEVVFVIIRDHFEENPQSIGYVGLIDPATSATIEGDLNSSTIELYKSKIAQNDHKVYEHCKKYRIRYTKIYTDQEPFVKLRRLFGNR
jgi:uncharacterized protein (DUF58 family)